MKLGSPLGEHGVLDTLIGRLGEDQQRIPREPRAKVRDVPGRIPVIRDEVQQRVYQEAGRFRGIDEAVAEQPAPQASRVKQVSRDGMVARRIAVVPEQDGGVTRRDRIDVDVHHRSVVLAADLIGYFVDAAHGGQAGADIDELPHAGLQRVRHGALQEQPALADKVPGVRADPHEPRACRAVDGPVLLAA